MIRAIVLDRLDGVLPHAGLAGEHHRVGAVEHGVGDVGGLGARGRGVADHRLEHLGRDDHRLGVAAGLLDDPLLQERHVLERALHAEVAARDHEAVEGLDDLVEVVDRLRLLDLGDHREQDALLAHDLAYVLDVLGRADERERDEVDAQVQRPAQVLDVLLRHRRHADTATPGRLMPLLSLIRPPTTTVGVHVGAVDLGHPEPHLAVVDQDLVACADVAGQALVGGGGDLVVARRPRGW